MDWTMSTGIAIGAFAGVPFGVLIMGVLSARAYEKGRSDEAKWILQEQR